MNTIQRKIAIIVLAGIVSIIANWVRVITLVLIADMSKMQSSLLDKHDNLGWVVFILCFTVFIIIAGRIDSGRKNDDVYNQAEVLNSPAARLVDNYYFRAFSATLIVSILPIFGWFMIEGAVADMQSHQLRFEAARKIDNPVWRPDYKGYDEISTWRINVDAREVEVTILSYSSQKQGKELIYFSNKLHDAKSKLKNIGNLEISKSFSINRSVLSNQSRKILIGWFYKVGEYETNNSSIAKLLQIPSMFQGTPVASLVTVSMECISEDCKMEKNQFLTRELIEFILDSIVVFKKDEN